MKCGKITCNRYADCHAKISSTANKTSLTCRCLPGFKGDGLSSCIPINHEGMYWNKIFLEGIYSASLLKLNDNA